MNNQRSPSISESDSDEEDDFDDEGINSSAVSLYLNLLLILK